MKQLEKQFYLEIKNSLQNYIESFEKAIKNKNEDLMWSDYAAEYQILQNSNLSESQITALKNIIKEINIGVVHSLFVSIDGGTALSDEGRALDLIDIKTGKPLTEGALHENFMEVFD